MLEAVVWILDTGAYWHILRAVLTEIPCPNAPDLNSGAPCPAATAVAKAGTVLGMPSWKLRAAYDSIPLLGTKGYV